MSPFEELVQTMSGRVRALTARDQVALFAAASIALSKAWVQWADTAGHSPDAALFERAVRAIERYLAGDQSGLTRSLLEEIERETPSEFTDLEGFTAAQDCWICLDTAVRSARVEFDAADSTWFLLEPIFQAVCERRFGVTDVGSNDQTIGEVVALDEPQMLAAVRELETFTERLTCGEIGTRSLSEMSMALGAICP